MGHCRAEDFSDADQGHPASFSRMGWFILAVVP
jgi:hypothetical protein